MVWQFLCKLFIIHLSVFVQTQPFVRYQRLRDIDVSFYFRQPSKSVCYYRLHFWPERFQSPFTGNNNISNGRWYCKRSSSRAQLVDLVKSAQLLQDPANNICTIADKERQKVHIVNGGAVVTTTCEHLVWFTTDSSIMRYGVGIVQASNIVLVSTLLSLMLSL